MNKPEGFEDCLSSFGPMIYDSYSMVYDTI